MPQAPRLAAPARIARPRIAHQRNLVDFRLQRLAVLSRLRRGAVSRADVCDADPYLVRSARFHGEPSRRSCPVCRWAELDLVTYVFGDELGQFSGRIRSRDEVAEMSTEVGEVDVYVVEVCQGCSWNHLDLTFTIGDGVPRRPPRRPADRRGRLALSRAGDPMGPWRIRAPLTISGRARAARRCGLMPE